MNMEVAKRWKEVLEIVRENVSEDWRPICRLLGVSKSDCEAISARQPSLQPVECMQAAMVAWRHDTASMLQPRMLRDALTKCGHQRTADIINLLMSDPRRDVDALLQPHIAREGRMKKAMYTISDDISACKQWRLLGQRLGLSGADFARIESSHGERRFREKCVCALYRWRLVMPLQQFKIGNLVKALKQCGFHALADIVSQFAMKDNPTLSLDKKKKGEVIVHFEIRSYQARVQDHVIHCPGTADDYEEYILNKMIIRFMDDLDSQTACGTTHPLVEYLYSINKCSIGRVSRRGMYFTVDCQTKRDQQVIWKLVETGEIGQKVSQYLASTDILKELNLVRVDLRAYLNNWELMTTRSESNNSKV